MATNLFRIGSWATDDATKVLLLRAGITTSGRVSTLRLNTPFAAGYQVTAGKTLYIVGMKIFAQNAIAADAAVALGYADNDVGLDVTTARTNPIPVLGDPEQATSALIFGVPFREESAHLYAGMVAQLKDCLIKAAPAGKYMYAKAFFGAAAMVDVHLYCVELPI